MVLKAIMNFCYSWGSVSDATRKSSLSLILLRYPLWALDPAPKKVASTEFTGKYDSVCWSVSDMGQSGVRPAFFLLMPSEGGRRRGRRWSTREGGRLAEGVGGGPAGAPFFSRPFVFPAAAVASSLLCWTTAAGGASLKAEPKAF